MTQLIYDKLNLMTERQRKLLDVVITLLLTGALVWAFWSFFQGQAVFNLFANDASKFRDYLVGLGGWASFTYLWLVILEVLIAFIPGWFVYPVGAAIFGFLNTVLLVMLANFIGASLSFWIGRRWGQPLLEKFISKKYMSKFHDYTEKNGAWAVFLLKINPITSFDVWNYLAGASSISFWKFSIANLIGILPLVVFSAALGEQSYDIAPQILGILLLLTMLYIVWYFVNLPGKISKLKNRKNDNSQ